MATLTPILPVKFDINEPEHLAAAKSLLLDGKQHPSLRFTLEQPFFDVRTMLTSKIVHQFFATSE